MRVALYQPDIPQNTGTVLSLAACLNVAADIILPAGFDLSSRALKRAALDYFEAVDLTRWNSFAEFRNYASERGARIVLLDHKSGGCCTPRRDSSPPISCWPGAKVPACRRRCMPRRICASAFPCAKI